MSFSSPDIPVRELAGQVGGGTYSLNSQSPVKPSSALQDQTPSVRKTGQSTAKARNMGHGPGVTGPAAVGKGRSPWVVSANQGAWTSATNGAPVSQGGPGLS